MEKEEEISETSQYVTIRAVHYSDQRKLVESDEQGNLVTIKVEYSKPSDERKSHSDCGEFNPGFDEDGDEEVKTEIIHSSFEETPMV